MLNYLSSFIYKEVGKYEESNYKIISWINDIFLNWEYLFGK